GADGRGHLDQPDVNVRQLVGGGNLVIDKAAGTELTTFVVGHLLAERAAERLSRATVDLAFDLRRVYRAPNVLDRRVPDELIGARFAVRSNPCDVDREGGRGRPHRGPTDGMDGLVLAH